jgi:hypothetical protein
MVTVDTATEKNLVIWEKKSTAPIASYNVYRESAVAGEYEAIGNVGADRLSVFTDTAVNPVKKAYIYKITTVLEDGTESDIGLCRPHKTIHLLTTVNVESGLAQLDWDHYYGFPYGTFYIYTMVKGREKDFSVADSMASSTTTWREVTASPDDTIYYRVDVIRPQKCYPTGIQKAGTGPYHHSLSNLDDNRKRESEPGTGVDGIVYGALKIYPNPFSRQATIEFPNPELSEYRVSVRNLSGKLVLLEKTNGNSLVIERGDLSPGLYSIELAGRKIYRDRFVIR